MALTDPKIKIILCSGKVAEYAGDNILGHATESAAYGRLVSAAGVTAYLGAVRLDDDRPPDETATQDMIDTIDALLPNIDADALTASEIHDLAKLIEDFNDNIMEY